MPVWLSLLTFIAGGLAAYYVAPALNVKFEQEKIRSGFIAENLRSTNNDTSKLLNHLRRVDDAILSGDKDKLNLSLLKLEDLVTALQWRAVEYEVIFGNDRIRSLVLKYQNDLTALSNEIRRGEDISPKVMYCRALNFIYSSHRVLRFISREAGLSLSESPAFRIPEGESCDPSAAEPSPVEQGAPETGQSKE